MRREIEGLLPLRFPLHALAPLAVGLLAWLFAWIGLQYQGVPEAMRSEEFALQLAGQTFAAGHLAMPMHAAARYLETFQVLQAPAYAAAVPPGPALLLAAGYRLGDPVYGVWLGVALLAAACTWMIQGAARLRWAILGGLATALWAGGLSAFAQSFQGLAAAPLGLAVAVGGAIRWRRGSIVTGALALGLGAGWLLLCSAQLFMGAALAGTLCLGCDRTCRPKDGAWRSMIAALLPLCLAGAFLATYQHATTGHWWRSPESLYRDTYTSQPSFWWQENRPAPSLHHWRMEQHDLAVGDAEAHIPVPAFDAFAGRLLATGAFLAGYPGMLLILGALAAGPSRSVRRWLLLLAAAGAPAVMNSVYVVDDASAAYVPLMGLGVWALRRWWTVRRRLGIDMWNAFVAFAVVFVLVALARGLGTVLPPMVSDTCKNRSDLIAYLDKEPGKDLVFVEYERRVPQNVEYVYNQADLDAAGVVWVRAEPGKSIDEATKAFPGRRLWWLSVLPNEIPQLRAFDMRPPAGPQGAQAPAGVTSPAPSTGDAGTAPPSS